MTARLTFTTSRLLDFATERELTAQTGYASERWPLVALKELVDNALDAAEDRREAANVVVSFGTDVDSTVITVSDDGPGIPPDVVARIVDFTTRTSSREAYVGLSRGAQGNALKTLVAMPFALAGDDPRYGVTVEAHGVRHAINFAVDTISTEPRIRHETEPSERASGTAITLRLPAMPVSRSEMAALLSWFRLLNPGHGINGAPLLPGHRKWTNADAPSALWFSGDRFRRLAAATIDHGRRNDRVRTVREFCAGFAGLSAVAKQKSVLDAGGWQGKTLAAALAPGGELDEEEVERLRQALHDVSTPIGAQRLGCLGKAAFEAFAGGEVGRVRRHKRALVEDPHGPAVVEAALVWTEGGAIPSGSALGVNFSAPIRTNHWTGAAFQGFDHLLARGLVESGDPVAVLAHVACPAAGFGDRGKRTLVLPDRVRLVLEETVDAVTAPWRRQKEAEIRDRRAAQRRADQGRRARAVSLKDAAWSVMEAAYLAASDDGRLPANARQIMYAARPKILEMTGKSTLDDQYFTQTLLPDFMAAHPDVTAEWKVAYDPRGTLYEPHTGKRVALGTLAVDQYLADADGVIGCGDGVPFMPDTLRETVGPRDRFGAALYIEKEGFEAILAADKLAERLDVAIIAGKGQSTTAARAVVDDFTTRHGVPVFVITDCDLAGLDIARTLREDTRRHRWNSDGATRIALTLDQARELDLQDEPAAPARDDREKRRTRMLAAGATDEEASFLLERRIELNALTSRQLVDLIESELLARGVRKVVPDVAVIRDQARGILWRREVNRRLREIRVDASKIHVPDHLQEAVADAVGDDPTLSWDAALMNILDARDGGSAC